MYMAVVSKLIGTAILHNLVIYLKSAKSSVLMLMDC